MKWSSTKTQFMYRFIYTTTLALKQFTELTANCKIGKPGCCRLFERDLGWEVLSENLPLL